MVYIGNKDPDNMEFHKPECSWVPLIKPEHKVILDCSYDEAIDKGFDPCAKCLPGSTR